jgi:hypothetical protein
VVSFIAYNKMFKFPGRLEAGEVSVKYRNLINTDLTHVDNDDTLWSCWFEASKTHIEFVEEFLKKKPEDIAWQVHRQNVCKRFGDIYFAMYILWESVNKNLEELDEDDESVNDNDLAKMLSLEETCSTIINLVSEGFVSENKNVNYAEWSKNTMDALVSVIRQIESIFTELERHNNEMETLFEEMGKKLEEASEMLSRHGISRN